MTSNHPAMFSPKSEYTTLAASLRFSVGRPAMLIRSCGFNEEYGRPCPRVYWRENLKNGGQRCPRSFSAVLETVLTLTTLVIAVLAFMTEAQSATAGTTLYINQYYEVRDQDAPIKYVFSGQTRIARITGSLSTNPRLQRLRVYTGWNLISLAVAAADLRAQLAAGSSQPTIEALYKWVPQSSNFVAIASGENLPAGTVLWLKSTTNATLSVLGAYAEPAQLLVLGGGNFVPSAGLEVWCLTNPLPIGVSLWKRDPVAGAWAPYLGIGLPSLSELPTIVAPGEAIFIRASAPAQFDIPPATLRINYYHQDHLESVAVATDAAGSLIAETAYHPWGEPRHEFQPGNLRQDYRFTQKEQDRESGLDYFEARYLGPLQGRFISPDPLLVSDGKKNPQSWNCYTYALNNPLRYVDPGGLYVWDESLGGAKEDSKVSEAVLQQRQAIREALTRGMEKAQTLPAGADQELVLRGFRVYGAEGTDNGVIVGTQSGGGGHTKYHDGKNIITLSPEAKGWGLAGTLAHEGTHAADNFEFWAEAKKDRKAAAKGPLNRTDYEQEFRGYKVESILAQVTHPKGHLNKGGYDIWDAKWKPDEIEKNRTAAINELLAKTPIYQFTPEKPGKRILP
jgi:RHS repeat-associated protein